MTAQSDGIDPAAEPSGTGCKECLAAGAWWFHLRRCAQCGHIGCCDFIAEPACDQTSSRDRPPGYRQLRARRALVLRLSHGRLFAGPSLAAPQSHPDDQPVPGPAGRVPPDWESQAARVNRATPGTAVAHGRHDRPNPMFERR